MKTILLSLLLTFTIAGLFSNHGHAKTCQHWGEAYKIGDLPSKIIKEASGLEWTPSHPDILFHINDSGDGANIYLTDLKGNFLKKLSMKKFFSWDSEDIAIGPCPHNDKECFFYGDIGDGRYFNTAMKIGIIELEELLKGKKTFTHILKVQLDTGPDDMEGMAIHPNGDLYLVSKDPGETHFFKIEKKMLSQKKVVAQFIATLNQRELAANLDKSLATALDISPDGKEVMLLTYENLIQINLDLAHVKGPVANLTELSKIITTPPLPQQEAVAYIYERPSSYGVLFDTEVDGSINPLYRLDCQLNED